MVVVAFVALVLTVLIQGVMLRRAAIAKQNEMAAARQSVALAQATYNQHIAAALRELERGTPEIERSHVRDMERLANALEKLNDDLRTPTEETRGGFRRWIKELEPRSDEAGREGREHD